MQNRDNNFEVLIEKAGSCFGKSASEIKNKYKDYPICLMEYIENETHEYIVEVRFDNQEATVSFSFDKDNNCNYSFLIFDNAKDEDLLIDYLVEFAEYNFRKSCWLVPNCLAKVEESKEGTFFYFRI